MAWLGWAAVVVLMLAGVAGTVLPVLPGALLVLAGGVLGAWLDGFERVSGWSLAVMAVFAAMAWATDVLSAWLGAKRVGASPQALIGAAIGTVLGVFGGLVGVFVLPFVGALAGEYMARQDSLRAGRVALATWIGMVVGTVVKLALTFMMIGVFVVAWLV